MPASTYKTGTLSTIACIIICSLFILFLRFFLGWLWGPVIVLVDKLEYVVSPSVYKHVMKKRGGVSVPADSAGVLAYSRMSQVFADGRKTALPSSMSVCACRSFRAD